MLQLHDLRFPPEERLPRQFVLLFEDTEPEKTTTVRIVDARPNAFPNGPVAWHGQTQGYRIGQQLGDTLFNQSYISDEFSRRHDVLHAAVTLTGWAPTMRAMLNLKRRSQPEIKRAEDSAQAIVAEEAIVLMGFRFRDRLADVSDIMSELAKPHSPENAAATPAEWEQVFHIGNCALDRLVETIDGQPPESKHAFLRVDLDKQSLEVSPTTFGP